MCVEIWIGRFLLVTASCHTCSDTSRVTAPLTDTSLPLPLCVLLHQVQFSKCCTSYDTTPLTLLYLLCMGLDWSGSVGWQVGTRVCVEKGHHATVASVKRSARGSNFVDPYTEEEVDARYRLMLKPGEVLLLLCYCCCVAAAVLLYDVLGMRLCDGEILAN